MPVIKVNDQQFSLNPGQTRLGGGSGVEVDLADPGLGVQAVVDVGGDGKAVIRRGSDSATVKVNGVLLGIEPTPLLHGDKVEIAGREMTYSDDAKGGATQFVSASDIAAMAAAKRSGPARATAATGGRLVSLVDGKEYTIPDGGVTMGRDAACSIVVAQTEVSRKHAEILPGENGYVVYDRSTNGMQVNGQKVNGSQLLSRADVIRIGSEEFRFYADVAKAAPTPATATPVAPAAPMPTATPAGPPAPQPPAAPAAPAPPPAAAPAPPVAPPAAPAARPVAPAPAPKPAEAPPAATAKPVRERPTAAPPPPQTKGTIPVWVWALVVIAVAGAAAYFLLLR